ncbi:MAG: phosphatidylglycerophosphatase A, partial [Candidatus Omnitrophica bacterium]|nr:phosphatidylglycerophosphatase A [Candidatus Omnitrophota bacterium]
LGAYSSGRAEKIFNKKDDERIVIDEVFGILLLFCFLPPYYPYLIAGFILFRVFDILKPYPIKKIQALSGSLGVMLDDILAAAYVYIIISIWGRFFWRKEEVFLALSVINSSGRGESRSLDKALVEKAKDGDKRAFDELYQKYKKPIFNYIYRMVRNRATAEDLTQETFVRAYMNLQSYREQNTFSAWLYRIAGNLVKNELRANVYRAAMSLDQPLTIDEENLKLIDTVVDRSSEPDLIARSHELHEAIQRVLDSLSVEHKTVLVLCDVQELSYEEAGEILNTNVGTVASRLSRARAEFNKKLRIEYDLGRDVI